MLRVILSAVVKFSDLNFNFFVSLWFVVRETTTTFFPLMFLCSEGYHAYSIDKLDQTCYNMESDETLRMLQELEELDRANQHKLEQEDTKLFAAETQRAEGKNLGG